jgi:hypothetical protein
MQTTTDTIGLPPAAEPGRPGSRVGRAIGTTVAVTVTLIGALIMASAAGLFGVQAFTAKDGGFISIEEERLTSSGYAIATDEIDLSGEIGGFGVDDLGAEVRLDADAGPGESVFVGIAHRADAERYLRQVEHTTVLGMRGDQPRYAQHDGGRLTTAPGERSIWVASSEGTGTQTVEWEPRDGHWMAVVANADGARGVDADVEASARASWLIWASLAALALGAAITAVGGFALARRRRDS